MIGHSRRALRRGARSNAPSAAVSTVPPTRHVRCVYIILFGSGLAGLGSSSQIAWANSTAVVHFRTLAFQTCFFVRVTVTGSWPARRNSICMPTKTALGSSPSSMLWFSNSYASDTHHLASLMTQDSLQVLPHLAPLNLCQHRRDGAQPRERRLPLDGLVEIKFQVTNRRQPRFTHRPSRIGSEIYSSRRGAIHRVRFAR